MKLVVALSLAAPGHPRNQFAGVGALPADRNAINLSNVSAVNDSWLGITTPGIYFCGLRT